MDQLKKAWDWFQRQHFWVLIVVATLVALGCWWHGASALSTKFAANKQIIDTEFKSIKDEIAKPFHANAKLQEQQKTEITNQGGSVLKIWQQLYNRQRENVLKWPDVLSKEFRQAVERLKFGDEIAVNLRENYQNYVAGHFPVLPKIVDAKELAANESGGGRSMGRGGGREGYGGGRYGGREGGQVVEEEDEHVVQWLNQQDVRDELDMPNRPTSMKIWVTQEDLWVYETLLGIIRRTNEAAGADRASNAAVRIIESLEVGRLAAMESRTHGRIAMAQPAAAAPGGGEAEGRGAPPSPMANTREMAMREMASEGGGRGGAEDAASGDAALLADRYLDNDEKPIAAPDPAAGASAFGTEYKRLPVRMVLQMDQRWLPHLISECANAPLQVEVKEVRINPSESGGSGGYGRGGREMGGYGSMAGQEGDQMGPEAEPNIKHVIVQGIIYIFNEPNTAAIQVADAQK
jgi:hypothetical protein